MTPDPEQILLQFAVSRQRHLPGINDPIDAAIDHDRDIF